MSFFVGLHSSHVLSTVGLGSLECEGPHKYWVCIPVAARFYTSAVHDPGLLMW